MQITRILPLVLLGAVVFASDTGEYGLGSGGSSYGDASLIAGTSVGEVTFQNTGKSQNNGKNGKTATNGGGSKWFTPLAKESNGPGTYGGAKQPKEVRGRAGKGPGVVMDVQESQMLRQKKNAAALGAMTGTFAVVVFALGLLYNSKPVEREDETTALIAGESQYSPAPC